MTGDAARVLTQRQILVVFSGLLLVMLLAALDSTIVALATAVAACGFALSWLLPERALRETVAQRAAEVATEMAEVAPLPR